MDIDLDVLLFKFELLFVEFTYSFFFFLNFALEGPDFVELFISSERQRSTFLFLEPFLHDVHLFHDDFITFFKDSFLLIKPTHLTLKESFLLLDIFATILKIVLSLISTDKLSM